MAKKTKTLRAYVWAIFGDGYPVCKSAWQIMDYAEGEGRLRYDDYVCEGPPEQCRDNPDGRYFVAVLSDTEAHRLRNYRGIDWFEEIPWEGRILGRHSRSLSSWGNLEAPENLFEEFSEQVMRNA